MKEDSLPLIPGEIADYRFSEEGILYSYSKSPVRTIEKIRNNVQLVKEHHWWEEEFHC